MAQVPSGFWQSGKKSSLRVAVMADDHSPLDKKADSFGFAPRKGKTELHPALQASVRSGLSECGKCCALALHRCPRIGGSQSRYVRLTLERRHQRQLGASVTRMIDFHRDHVSVRARIGHDPKKRTVLGSHPVTAQTPKTLANHRKPPGYVRSSGIHLDSSAVFFMRNGKSIWLLGVIVMLVFVAGVFYYFNNPYARGVGGPRIDSMANLQKIGLALRDYHSEHNGNFPDRFSDLIPRYISSTNLSIFFVTPHRKNKTSTLSEKLASNPQLVDVHSSYVYLGTLDIEGGILAVEKPNLWESNNESWMSGRCAALFDDYHVDFVAIPELKKRLPPGHLWFGSSSTNDLLPVPTGNAAAPH